MTRRTRTVFFLISIFLFFILAPMALLYLEGYQFNWQKGKLIKTGGIYLKIFPRENVLIYLNNKIKKNTTFFSNSVFIKNLLPGEYEVKIENPKFQTWQKKLEVFPGQVTERKNIYLVPQKPLFIPLLKEVKKIFPLENKNLLLLEREKDNEKILTIYNLERKEVVFETKIPTPLLLAKSSLDGKNIFIILEGKPQKNFLLSEKNNNFSLKELDASLATTNIKKIFFSPQDQFKIVFLEEETQSLWEKNLQTGETNLLADKISDFFFRGSVLYWITNEGEIFKKDLQVENITPEFFSFKNIKEIKIFNEVPYLFLISEKYLLLFNERTKIIKEVLPDISKILPSENYKKLALFNDWEIWLFYLENDPEALIAKEEKVFLLRTSEKINDLFWFNNNYFIFSTNEKIKMAEIDNYDKIQIWTLAYFKKPEIIYLQEKKTLFVLSEGVFYFYTFP